MSLICRLSKFGKFTAALRFRKNATNFCQQADIFVILKIKQRWRTSWDEKKVRLINSKQYKERLLESGKLPDPGKVFFLKMAARVLRNVNNMREKNGLTYAQKAMNRCDLSRYLNDQWHLVLCWRYPLLQLNMFRSRIQYFYEPN